jgi:hypothetical protein
MNNTHTTKVETLTAGTLFSRTCSIPLYQREYAWGREEIWQLLDDLQEAFDRDPSRHYHIGSITAFLRTNASGRPSYELIDGQQRTITLALLLRLLAEFTPSPLLSTRMAEQLRFENRPDAEAFLAAFCDCPEEPPASPTTFRRAVDAMCDHPVFGEEKREKLPAFAEFVRSHAALFLVTMSPETDVSAYFEIMNNRGVQLEFHELLKAKFIAKLPDDVDQSLFDRLWTVCSRMDGYLADRLDKENVKALLAGKQWLEFDFKRDAIRDTPDNGNAARSIIPDFPNFLLHVLRFHAKTKDVSLDERNMRKEFDDRFDSIDPVQFLDSLLKTRLRFDRFAIKAEGGTDGVEPCWHIEGNNDWSKDDMERLTHLQAMLQVSNPSKRNKEWLSLLLNENGVENAPGLIALLERFVRERLRECGDIDSLCCRGTGTPHLVLNLIDYLMYRANPEKYTGENNSFRFAYRNSVEHHFPQALENETWTNDAVNDIGNLYLLSKSDNSSLNDRSPKYKVDKVTFAGGQNKLPPKRREMYKLTVSADNTDNWTPNIMRKHSEEVVSLLKAFLSEE